MVRPLKSPFLDDGSSGVQGLPGNLRPLIGHVTKAVTHRLSERIVMLNDAFY